MIVSLSSKIGNSVDFGNQIKPGIFRCKIGNKIKNGIFLLFFYEGLPRKRESKGLLKVFYY